MPKLVRLTARAQIHHEVREPGYEFILEDGEVGPHTSRQIRHELHGESSNAHAPEFFIGQYGALWVDEPLFEVIKDLSPPPPPPEPEPEPEPALADKLEEVGTALVSRPLMIEFHEGEDESALQIEHFDTSNMTEGA